MVRNPHPASPSKEGSDVIAVPKDVDRQNVDTYMCQRLGRG